MDLWTSEGYLPILGVCAFVIDDNFNIMELKLACKVAPYPHDKPTLKLYFEKVLDSYLINHSQVVSVTTDNASNLELNTRQQTTMLGRSTETAFHQIRCVLHTLNLCLQDTEKLYGNVYDVYVEIKNIYNFFSASSKKESC